ncbi:hypothetical protein D1646_19230 [Pseudoflavonifractor sp. 60]|uniref:hypothetical protein n=1 Tax=Pseudoflavonifractor sp. 60 TaxID=2304576 RepID=UPI00136C81C0|nr:hypothetical protein [Pseudoflavonifractor sp. 60]NBI68877.1 hypothetical protein [Pseudoflavonifractor sp. 60]
MRRKWAVLAVMLVMTALLGGCLFRSPDDLYRQPERSVGYEKLNNAIRVVRMGLESEFGVRVEDATILSGDNTANIQLQDLDGDGRRESAVTFLRVPGIEKPIKIYIFTQIGEEYVVTGVVEGEASAIHAIDYAQINGEGRKELAVNWQINTGAYQLGVYTLDGVDIPDEETVNAPPAVNRGRSRAELAGNELLLTRCSVASDSSSGCRLLDMDLDTRTEVLVTRMDASGLSSQVELYGWQDGALESVALAELSTGITSINRIRTNYLAGEYDQPALYVTSTLSDGSRAIDVVAYVRGEFKNVAMGDAGVSREVIQGYTEINPTDVNQDEVAELPSPYQLPSYGESASSNFWLIDWAQYDERGHRNHVLTTYHNMSDGWYLEIPESWRDQITISRNDQVTGRREVVFSLWRGDEEEPRPFLSVYRVSNSGRSSSVEENWVVLREEENIIYAARFHENGWNSGLDELDLLERFNTIQRSWYNE